MTANRITFTITPEILRRSRQERSNPLAAALTHYGLLNQPEVTGVKTTGIRGEKGKRLTYQHAPPLSRWLQAWQKRDGAEPIQLTLNYQLRRITTTTAEPECIDSAYSANIR